MATFVLVHGAWQTAATWDWVVPLLKQHGHEVFVPRLTGLDPSAGPLTGDVTLETHIADVVREIERWDLNQVVLVGHSYGGMVITGVANCVPSRIKRLVYVDAFVPESAQSALSLMPPNAAEKFRTAAAADSDHFRLPPNEGLFDLWGLREGPARDFVRARFSDFSIRCFEQPLPAANSAADIARSYIACVAENYPARAIFAPFVQRARTEHWLAGELVSGHDCQAEVPEQLSALLER